MHVSAALINSARTDWMTLDNLNHGAELTEQSIINAPKTLGGHIRRCSIYDQAFIDDPTGKRLVDKSVVAGEEARVLPRIPMKMQLADTSAVLLPLTFTGTGGAMLVRAQPVVAGIREFFELLWGSAAPLTEKAPSGKSPLTPAQQKVLELLAQGYQDEAIARRIGVSDTTVHRHAQAIQKRLKAKTRFEASVIAHRMGWIG
jgi:DNA-binding CsgD family transcriptional regulator